MKKRGHRCLMAGGLLLVWFTVWTVLVCTIDVQPAGPEGTAVGFASWNIRFHQWTGVHLPVYVITDWMGLIPVGICVMFGSFGLGQLIKRRSLRNVDPDLFLLGIYYLVVVCAYLLFEQIPINYRPIPIEGRVEASYPSSTTLLVQSVLPTLSFQAERRLQKETVKKLIRLFVLIFSACMVFGRLICGVHWFTDIAGGIFLSLGLFCLYKGMVWMTDRTET